MRELTRARGAAQRDLQAKGQQVSSLLLRLGRHYPERKTWGKAHMKWLAGQKLEHLEQRLALEEMLAVRQATDRVQRLEQAIRAAVPDWSLAPLVTALKWRCAGSTSSPRRRCWPRSAICRGYARHPS